MKPCTQVPSTSPPFTWAPGGEARLAGGKPRGAGRDGRTHLAGRGWRPPHRSSRGTRLRQPKGDSLLRLSRPWATVWSPAPPRPPLRSLHTDRQGSPEPTPSSFPDPTLHSLRSLVGTRYLQSGSTILQVVLHGEARGVPSPLGEER